MEDEKLGRAGIVATQVLCGAAVVAGLKTVPALWNLHLITQPVQTLQIALTIIVPVVILNYVFLVLLTSKTRSVWWSLGCGLLSLPVGTVVAALVALAFGAPTSFEFAARTWHWACLMSSLTVLPAAIVLGASWTDWQRVFAFTKPHGGVELAICIPAHGAALGAWVGAWPMPLDWERPWQVRICPNLRSALPVCLSCFLRICAQV
jgi:phosphatidylinositol glycan class F